MIKELLDKKFLLLVETSLAGILPVICCAMLCCVMFCTELCCCASCCSMLGCFALRCCMLGCAALRCAALCCAVLCYVDSANYTQPLPVQKSSLSQGFCQGLVFLQVTGSIM